MAFLFVLIIVKIYNRVFRNLSSPELPVLWPMQLLNPAFSSRPVFHWKGHVPKKLQKGLFLKTWFSGFSFPVSPISESHLQSPVVWRLLCLSLDASQASLLFALLVLSFFVSCTVFAGAPELHECRPLHREACGGTLFPPTGLPVAINSRGALELLEERNTEAHTNGLPSLSSSPQRSSRFSELKYPATVGAMLRL